MRRIVWVISLMILSGPSSFAQQKPRVWFVANRPHNELDHQLMGIMKLELDGQFALARVKEGALFKLFVQAHRAEDEEGMAGELFVMLMTKPGKVGRRLPITWRYIRHGGTLEQAARQLSRAFLNDARRLGPMASPRGRAGHELANRLSKTHR